MEKRTIEPTSDVESLACEKCARRYVCVRAHDDRDRLTCVCGGELVPAAPLPGLYERLAATGDAVVQEEEPERASEAPKGVDQEADVGYGRSHGYAPGHGGPTGPGDAPAGEKS